MLLGGKSKVVPGDPVIELSGLLRPMFTTGMVLNIIYLPIYLSINL